MKRLIICLLSSLLITGCSDGLITYDESLLVSESKSSETSVINDTTDKNVDKAIESPFTTTESAIETTTQVESTEPVNEMIPDDGQLVRILDYIPDAEIDLRYATTNNFTGAVIYDDPEAYLCYGTVKKLIQVQNELKEMGYRILIWDAYRSIEAQWKLWETYPDSTFVANPNNGITSHSRGNTIDISLVYEDGSPVEMPSAFDEFAAIADRDYTDVSETAAANSRLLEEVMYRNGFTGYRGEWWDYSDTNRYELIPVSHDEVNIDDAYLTEILTHSNFNYNDIADSSQLVVVDSDGYTCDVYLYEKKDDIWSQILNTSGYVGKNGITDNKVEGDYCTPSGLYTLGFGFGTELVDTKIEYRLINSDCYWVDDVNSKYYNQWIESDRITWTSAEHMIDYPESYHYGIVINYNISPIVPGKGSAIFLHCSNGGYTAGCVAIPESEMIALIHWIDPTSAPIILIS